MPILLSLVWRGEDWLEVLSRFPFRGSALDASLMATGVRVGLPPILSAVVWLTVLAATIRAIKRAGRQLDRSTASLLVTASLLLAPYSASNSVLTPLALGVTALYARRPGLGLFLFLFADGLYLFVGNAVWRQNYEATYWTAFLLVLWLVFLFDLGQQSKSPSPE